MQSTDMVIVTKLESAININEPSGVLGTIFLGGGASELSTNMCPYNVTLDKRGPKARVERRRCEVFLGGSGGMPPRKIFKFRVSAMPFPGLWGKI
jgi:hypothetical protein